MELRDYLRGLRRHWVAVVLMTLVGVAVSYGWYAIQTPVYQATAVGLVKTREIAASDEANQSLVSSANDTIARSKVPTYLDMATWKPVADRVIDELRLDTTPDRIVTEIGLENPIDTNIIRVTASGGSPESAAELAQAWPTRSPSRSTWWRGTAPPDPRLSRSSSPGRRSCRPRRCTRICRPR